MKDGGRATLLKQRYWRSGRGGGGRKSKTEGDILCVTPHALIKRAGAKGWKAGRAINGGMFGALSMSSMNCAF